VRACCGIAGLVLAVLLAGCAGDPHPAAPDTLGDPWHPPSNEVPPTESDSAAVRAPVPSPAPDTHDAKQMR